MDGLGLLVVMAFIILILVIFNNESCPNCVKGEYTSLRDEGFENGGWDSYASKPQTSMLTQPTIRVPIVGPAAKGLTKEPVGYSGVSDLPSAPVANLGEVNSLPFQDPRFEKVSTQMLRQLKQDMDGFAANEAPHLKDRSDPAIRLPLTRFQGDYQRIKDELSVVDRTPGFESQLAVEDLNDMAANLRFLQRTYRLYAANEMVPAPQGGLSKVGVNSVEEGFKSGYHEGFYGTDVCMSGDLDTKTCSVFNNILNLSDYLYSTQRKIKSPTFFGTDDEKNLRAVGTSVLINPGFAKLCVDYNANPSNFANYPSLNDLQQNCPALKNKDVTQDLLNIISTIDTINTKYKLGITSSSQIPTTPASLDGTSTNLPGLKANSATIMSSPIYQKYFPSGSSPDSAGPNSGCSTAAASFSNCEILNNTTKFLNAVLTAYAKKVMNIQTNNFFTLDSATQQKIGNQPDIKVANNTLPYFESIEQAQEYMKNKDQYIVKIGLGEVNRSVIKAYLDKRYEWMNPTGPMSEEDYKKITLETISLKLINQLNGLDLLNSKYSLNITKDVIMNTPQMSPAPPKFPPFNDKSVSSHFLYQKYFSNSAPSAPVTQPTRPTVPGVTTKTITPSNTIPPVVTSYSGDPADQPISVAELNVLRQKIAVEILRLQASGASDPVLSARVNVFKKIQTAVEGIATQVENGSMRPQDIPIKKRDYQKFLPALGDQSAGVSGLLSNTGYPSLSSLFNAYDRGDVTGAEMTQNLFQHYADILLQGMSYKLDISYTSPNEVAARQAEATKAAADLANASMPNPGIGHQIFAGLSGAFQTSHPMTSDGARGAFDAYTRQLDMQNFQGDLSFGSQGLPDGSYARQSVMPNSAAAANFDWKARAQTICDNVKKMGMNPADFGCQPNPQGSAQNADFSWRGYSKMVCNRLKTVADPGVPEQVGCPPDSWRGWRT